MALPRFVNLTLGMGVALFIGYCIYFDRKRLSAPDYKKRVHERRRRNRMKNATVVPCANNKEALEEYFFAQMNAGVALIRQNQVEEGLTHFTNGIILCAHPIKVVRSLRRSISRHVYKLLVRKLKGINVLPSTEPEDYSDDEGPRKT
ncbi:mitochondrial import receptor subunit TOM20 homolog B-like [Drosophila bipectinata]|uniref:mitochondrial import receptor subunit TOM20 homolog B-like n=1 Tax=Drosophila bipectinata TaxID=42026 RepID=UPI001C89A37B|nr:mitochondrial import receptor subunit TOM20 homolog B-like [Drosophila bipectinata]